MQRGGQAEEVAQAIFWLLSDKASYVTGSFIDLAGGNKTGKLSDRMQQLLHPVLHQLKASRRCWQSPLCTS
ncbi:SDR family oxidoreductase [Escherichia coli]